MDTLKPPVTVLMKLGSLAVHVEELLSPDGHEFDKAVIDALLQDEELKIWLEEMDEMAFLPKKRKP